MLQVCKSADGKYLSDDALETLDKTIKEEARKHLKSYPIILRSGNQFQYIEKLDDLMDKKYDDFKNIIKKQNRDYILKKAVPLVGVGVGTVAFGALALMKPR